MTSDDEQFDWHLEGGEDDRVEADELEAVAEPEVCRSTADELEATGDDDVPALLYELEVVEKPGEVFDIVAGRENPDVVPWGFWGGVVAAATAGFVLLSGALTGAAIRYSIANVLVVAALLITGLVVYRVGRRTTLDEVRLCEIDTRRGIISWPTEPGATPVAVAFRDVRELTFGLIEVPVGDSNSRTRVDAATVRIRDDRGRELPIIEASTEKGETHRIARMFADLLDLSVNYEGTDVGEWADRRPSLPA